MKISDKVVTILKKGGVVVCPTDTVYGLIAYASNKKAVDKIFKIKKRSKKNPLPFFISDLKMAKRVAFINKEQEKFLKKVWPGKITVVLNRVKHNYKYEIYGAKKNTIALRIPSYKFVLDLVSRIGPLAQTSANIAGEPASGKIKEVIKQFENQKMNPDFIIDKGNLKTRKPSTIIDLTGKKPKTLRK